MKKNIKIGMVVEYLKKEGFKFSFEGDTNANIVGFSSLFNYKPETLTFIVPERSFKDFEKYFSHDSITLIIKSDTEKTFECFNNTIIYDDPRELFFAIVEQYFDQTTDESVTGISSNPEVYKRNSYISDRSQIGKNVKIGIGCVIEADVVIGDNTEINHNVVIRNRTKIGSNCTIFSGTIIGERGFNYTTDNKGKRHMLKHYGGVTIEDDVHIGDSCYITRGAIDDTIIKCGVKINKNIVIAHNVVIGENTIVTAPVFICGSVIIGKNCHVAASIIRNQVSIGDNAVLGLGSVIVKNVESGEAVVGNPARPINRK